MRVEKLAAIAICAVAVAFRTFIVTRYITLAFAAFALAGAVTCAAAGSERVSFVDAGFGISAPAS